MLSGPCEQEDHETCFENELDGCRCACHPDPEDCPAAVHDTQLNKSGGGRAQDARPGSIPPVPSVPPASAFPRRAAGSSAPAHPSRDPRAGADPKFSAAASDLALGAAADQSPPGAGRRRAAGAVPGGSKPPAGPANPRGGSLKPGRSVEGPPRPGQGAMAAAMSEDRGPDSLDAHVRRLLRDLGLRGYHTHDSRRSHGGFPDWTITGRRTIFRELKTQRGKVSPAQQEWLDALTEAGDDAAVWRPIDLLTGRIARELAAISKFSGAVAWTA